MNNQNPPLNLPDFVAFISLLDGPIHKGAVLNICGTDYNAWNFDAFIYDAIDLSAKVLECTEVSYERVLHIRYWLRENYQHGHQVEFDDSSSMHDVKNKIDQVIALEFCDDGNGSNMEQKMHSLAMNENILSAGGRTVGVSITSITIAAARLDVVVR